MPTKRIWWLGLLCLLLVGTAGLWWMDFDPPAWWVVGSLAQVDDAGREAAAARVGELGGRALPGLARMLRQPGDAACLNARAGLVCLVRRPDVAGQLAGWVDRLAADFGRMSPAGQVALLGVPAEAGPPGEEHHAAWNRLLAEVRQDLPDEVRAAGLALAGFCLAAPGRADAVEPARAVIASCLTADDPSVRLRAVQLSLLPDLNLDREVARLLRDPAVEVRRAAVLLVGSADRTVPDEALLPCLHDADPEVQRLCEAALRGRGRTPRHIRLGRLLTDPSPLRRLGVLDHLNDAGELDPAVWLRKLSADPADSVRAAAARVMAAEARPDLRHRLEQMRDEDPSPTVSQLAGFYLRQK